MSAVPGLNPPQAREPGRDPRPGLDRRRIAAWYAAFVGYAALLAVFSRHADQSWGIWASGGYLLAAITAVSYRGSRGRYAALLIAAAGALAAPLTWLAIRAPATADVQVVARAATLLQRHGSPYLGPGQLSAWRSYDPYLPAMTVFGLFRAAGLPGVTGDPRLWITLTCVALHPRPPAGPGQGPKRDAAMRRSPEPGTERPGHGLPRIPRVPKPGDTDGTDRSVVRGGPRHRHDTPSGNIWRPGAEPGQPSGDEPGRPGRGASLSSPDRRTRHHRPERGPLRPDKETT
jgi:hypothetical protein